MSYNRIFIDEGQSFVKLYQLFMHSFSFTESDTMSTFSIPMLIIVLYNGFNINIIRMYLLTNIITMLSPICSEYTNARV